jgi:hypothetical protein
MKDLTIDRRKPVKAEGLSEQLTQPDPPTARRTRKVVLTIGRKRYELTSHTEVREITRGPAKLIQMPSRPTIE